LELQMDHSVLGFSHEMKVLHIDLIERIAEYMELSVVTRK